MNEATDNTEKLKHTCVMIYVLYALSSILQFHETTLIPGLLAIITALILNTSNKTQEEAKGTIFESHLRWARRTFYIGTLVLLPIAIIISSGLILAFTNIGSVANTTPVENSEVFMNAIYAFLSKDIKTVILLTLVTMTPLLFWWLKRCWIGYKFLQEDKPVENINSWL